MIALHTKKGDSETLIPELLYDMASDNIKSDFLRRWWTKKYNLPPTDKRLHAYTIEALTVEFLEDAIENGTIFKGADDKPYRIGTHKGVKIYKTGFERWDKLEEEWASEVASMKNEEDVISFPENK